MISSSLFLGSVALMNMPSKVSAGFGYPICITVCLSTCAVGGVAMTAATYGIAAPTVMASCMEICVTICFPTCFSNNTTIVSRHYDQNILMNISEIKSGDKVLTINNHKPTWTEVLSNTKVEGDFKFIKLFAQNLDNTSQIKSLEITPEHGLILFNDNGPRTIDQASNLEIGDVILDSEQNKLSVFNISYSISKEKYVLLTKSSTVLASDIYVTTMCNEEVAGGEKLFSQTIDDWQSRHFFDDAHDLI